MIKYLFFFLVVSSFSFINIRMVNDHRNFKNYEKYCVNNANNLPKINLQTLRTINDNHNDNNLYQFIFFYRVTDCSSCIFNLFSIINEYIDKDVSIKVVIIHPDFNEIKVFCDNYYEKYYKSVDFYYDNHILFNSLKIRFTPLLLLICNNENKFASIINQDLGPLKRLFKKYVRFNVEN